MPQHLTRSELKLIIQEMAVGILALLWVLKKNLLLVGNAISF